MSLLFKESNNFPFFHSVIRGSYPIVDVYRQEGVKEDEEEKKRDFNFTACIRHYNSGHFII